MTNQKSFKTKVRARMDKTGQSYTTARRHLLESRAADGIEEKLSDKVVRERTGRTWKEWFVLLDRWGAKTRSHTQIARWLVQEHEVDGWWSQSVTVAYEQARGLRAPGQGRDGLYTANATKTINVSVDALRRAFTDGRIRAKWLSDATLKVRRTTSPASFRADWEDGATRIAVGFAAKADGKSQVSVQHERITDAETTAELKTYWRERFVALKQLLEA